MKMTKENPKIFVVHPFETGDGGYHVSYKSGGKTHNDTVKSFRTFAAAKKQIQVYGRKIGEKYYMYDSPSGVKVRPTVIRRRIVRRPVRRQQQGLNFGYKPF